VVTRAIVAIVGLAFAVASASVVAPSAAIAASAVFNGDPVDSVNGAPFEILPGQPLVRPGADGRFGTADDVVDTAIVGDIDLVVRLGAVPGGGTIPDPSPSRGAVPLATAGLRGAGTPIPFTVYLSDGAVSPSRPYGNLLAAADMNGLPALVLVFADRNGDRMIGPLGRDGAADVRALAELEPVGREVAIFTDGVATGSVVVTVGSPPSAGGVELVASAFALTGATDPAFFKGFVPTGPAITTALPFFPDRDPARIFSADIGPLQPSGTLNPELHPAGLPAPGIGLSLALPTDGSSPTVDVAKAVAGPAVCARLVEKKRGKRGIAPEPPFLTLGTSGSAARGKLVLVAVDRLGNPTDVATPLTARVVVDGPLGIAPDRDHAPASESIAVTKTRGVAVSLRPSGAATGSIRVVVGGALCQRLAFEVRPERTLGVADALVAQKGRGDFRTIGDAVAGATDRNGDGRIAIEVGEGIFRENVALTRAVELRGAGPGRTVIDGHGAGPALQVASTGALASRLTATGGTSGVDVTTASLVQNLEARGNLGAGFRLLATGSEARVCSALDNAGAGFAVESSADVTDSSSLRNSAAGISVGAVANVTATGNEVAANGGNGIEVLLGTSPTVAGNAIAGNIASGIVLDETTGGTVSANRSAANDDNGLDLHKANDAVIDGNDFSRNGGFGMRIDRSSSDFDAAPGVQAPPGTNDVSNNRKGALDIR
jgi:hypothetical protein